MIQGMHRNSLSALPCFLLTFSALAMAGCGGGGGDDSDSATVAPPSVPPESFQAVSTSASRAGRNSDGTVYFSEVIGLQRVTSAASISTLPPAWLSVRFVNVSTGFSYGIISTTRSVLAASDSLDGSTDHNGVWYYRPTNNLGYSIPAGTMIRAEIIDDGATVTGDELQADGYTLYVGSPLAAASNSSPIPVTTLTVPGPG